MRKTGFKLGYLYRGRALVGRCSILTYVCSVVRGFALFGESGLDMVLVLAIVSIVCALLSPVFISWGLRRRCVQVRCGYQIRYLRSCRGR